MYVDAFGTEHYDDEAPPETLDQIYARYNAQFVGLGENQQYQTVQRVDAFDNPIGEPEVIVVVKDSSSGFKPLSFGDAVKTIWRNLTSVETLAKPWEGGNAADPLGAVAAFAGSPESQPLDYFTIGSLSKDLDTRDFGRMVGRVVAGGVAASAASAWATGVESTMAGGEAVGAFEAGELVGFDTLSSAASMPAATPPSALSQLWSSAAAQWAELPKFVQNVVSSFATSKFLQSLQPSHAATARPVLSTLSSGGFTMGDEEGFNLDWNRLGELGLQILVNRNAAPSALQLTSTGTTPAAPMQVGFPGLGVLGGAARALGLTGLGAAAGAAVGVIRSVGGRILGWILPSGAKVSRSAAVDLAKSLGLTAAAAAIGASASELAEAVMQEHGRKHRRRGISAAALSTTTRTMARVERMHRRIAKAARHHAR